MHNLDLTTVGRMDAARPATCDALSSVSGDYTISPREN